MLRPAPGCQLAKTIFPFHLPPNFIAGEASFTGLDVSKNRNSRRERVSRAKHLDVSKKNSRLTAARNSVYLVSLIRISRLNSWGTRRRERRPLVLPPPPLQPAKMIKTLKGGLRLFAPECFKNPAPEKTVFPRGGPPLAQKNGRLRTAFTRYLSFPSPGSNSRTKNKNTKNQSLCFKISHPALTIFSRTSWRNGRERAGEACSL